MKVQNDHLPNTEPTIPIASTSIRNQYDAFSHLKQHVPLARLSALHIIREKEIAGRGKTIRDSGPKG